MTYYSGYCNTVNSASHRTVNREKAHATIPPEDKENGLDPVFETALNMHTRGHLSGL